MFSFSYTFYYLIANSYAYKCRASPEQQQKMKHAASLVGQEEEGITGAGRAGCLVGGCLWEGWGQQGGSPGVVGKAGCPPSQPAPACLPLPRMQSSF